MTKPKPPATYRRPDGTIMTEREPGWFVAKPIDPAKPPLEAL